MQTFVGVNQTSQSDLPRACSHTGSRGYFKAFLVAQVLEHLEKLCGESSLQFCLFMLTILSEDASLSLPSLPYCCCCCCCCPHCCSPNCCCEGCCSSIAACSATSAAAYASLLSLHTSHLLLSGNELSSSSSSSGSSSASLAMSSWFRG